LANEWPEFRGTVGSANETDVWLAARPTPRTFSQ
jgi:hypothetical protein